MPAVSSAQQRLMAQALGVKRKEIKISELDPKYRKEIVELSKKMTEKELEDFASTKTKKLPHHVDEKDNGISTFTPVMKVSGLNGIFEPEGPMGLKPFLDTDRNKKKPGKKNLQNLKDYRDWIAGK
jgi:hypothetical protein